MNWLHETSTRHSQKNGLITVEKTLGAWRVLVGGYSETSPGLNDIWHDALVRAQSKLPHKVERVLILGLGGGGMLKAVYTLFPGCSITAVEHDAEMIALTKELQLYEPFPLPKIVEQDAGAYVAATEEKYDVLAVDLFRGGEPSPLLLEEQFLSATKNILLPGLPAQPGGVLLINVADSKEYLLPAGEYFAHSQAWQFRYNHLGMFWN